MLFRRSQTLTYASAFTSSPSIPPYKHTQAQSPLIDFLPAEIRNEIYIQVFTFEDRPPRLAASTDSSPHPLSLLLTCRRIYHEATVLAFGTYTFPIHPSSHSTYLGLRAAVSHLSNHQVEAVRSVSVLFDSSSSGLVLANVLLVFPCLHRFVIRTERRKDREHSWHSAHQPTHPTDNLSEDLYLKIDKNYAPSWFSYIVETAIHGRAYAWQDGSKWTVQWPQMESALCYSMVKYGKDGIVREELRMDTDALGIVDGVQACGCGCGNVSWTAAILKQEGGRKVEVDILYFGEEEEHTKKTSWPRVLLVPGTAPSAEVIVKEAGMGYEVSEEYWEAIRQRNGNFGALCRGLWRRAVWPVTVVGRKNVVNDESVASEVASEATSEVERA